MFDCSTEIAQYTSFYKRATDGIILNVVLMI